MNIPANIRKARIAAKLTQTALAERCGVWKSCISRLEAGKRTPAVRLLGILAAALGVKVSDLTK